MTFRNHPFVNLENLGSDVNVTREKDMDMAIERKEGVLREE
jgi:hypothetical protein